jgi:hypothetical protein
MLLDVQVAPCANNVKPPPLRPHPPRPLPSTHTHPAPHLVQRRVLRVEGQPPLQQGPARGVIALLPLPQRPGQVGVAAAGVGLQGALVQVPAAPESRGRGLGGGGGAYVEVGGL